MLFLALITDHLVGVVSAVQGNFGISETLSVELTYKLFLFSTSIPNLPGAGNGGSMGRKFMPEGDISIICNKKIHHFVMGIIVDVLAMIQNMTLFQMKCSPKVKILGDTIESFDI